MLTLILIMILLLTIALVHGYVESFRRGPSHCMGCGKCEHSCPQHLPIRELLKEVAKTFEGGEAE